MGGSQYKKNVLKGRKEGERDVHIILILIFNKFPLVISSTFILIGILWEIYKYFLVHMAIFKSI